MSFSYLRNIKTLNLGPTSEVLCKLHSSILPDEETGAKGITDWSKAT